MLKITSDLKGLVYSNQNSLKGEGGVGFQYVNVLKMRLNLLIM